MSWEVKRGSSRAEVVGCMAGYIDAEARENRRTAAGKEGNGVKGWRAGVDH